MWITWQSISLQLAVLELLFLKGLFFKAKTLINNFVKCLLKNTLWQLFRSLQVYSKPYSGVKTSILILDKSLAKKTNSIAFFKIENDGFGLGAQRREIDKNDLPQARTEINEYIFRLRNGKQVEEFQFTLGLIVKKEKVSANYEYNLSGERYRENGVMSHIFPLVRIGDVCTINPRKNQLLNWMLKCQFPSFQWLI